MPDNDCNNDLAALTMDERQDRDNERESRRRVKWSERTRELTGKMEWPEGEEE